jgi:hypothetical protein
MRKLVSLSLAAFLALSMIAIAGESGDKSDKTVIGTVSFVDSASKSMVVKDTSGNNVTVYWTDSTKLDPSMPQEGASVTVTLDSKDQGGKPVAKSITVQQPKKPY